MCRFDDGVAATARFFGDECLLLARVGSPQDEDDVVRLARDGRDDPVGEGFPALALV